MERILYKEKPDLKSLAQKCLELERIDYSKIHPSQRDEIIAGLKEDLSSLEQITEKQSVLHELYQSEKRYHESRQSALGLEIQKYTEEVIQLRQELESEKNQRANLLEYENYAKHINAIPRCEETMELIQSILEQHEEVNTQIMVKANMVNRAENTSQEILRQLRALIESTDSMITE